MEMDKEWNNRLRFYKGGKCRTCGMPITNKNKSGFCRKHHGPRTEEVKRKISLANSGESNGLWKGNDVSLKGLHKWIERHKPKPDVCERCRKQKPIDLANISQNYKRDINDFEWLCRSCHMRGDGRINNLKQYAKKDYKKGSSTKAGQTRFRNRNKA